MNDWTTQPLKSLEQIAMQKQFDAKITEFLRAQQLACDQLTEQQLATVIRQALECGDLLKYVRQGDNAQVVYVPYREHESMKSQIKELKEMLEYVQFGSGCFWFHVVQAIHFLFPQRSHGPRSTSTFTQFPHPTHL